MMIFITVLITIFYLLFSKPIFGIEVTKYKNNPLTLQLNYDYIEIRQAYIYKENNQFKGILAARKREQTYFSLVKIESNDGYNWSITKEVINNGKDLTNPRLFKDSQGNIKLLFAYQEATDFYKIYSLNCDQDLNCNNFKQFFIEPDKNNQYENHGFFAPFLYYQDGVYYLFYGSWGNYGFYINLAYSNDLNNWIKCRQDLLNLQGDGVFVKEIGEKIYIFFHYSDGIGYGELSKPITCQSNFQFKGNLLTKTDIYDSNYMIYPSVLEEKRNIYLYYTGLSNNNLWRLNLASFYKPVVLIPGLFASWNKKAMIYNQPVNYSDWKMLSFVKEYQGIISTLKNLGFKENNNLFIFNYDWRKRVDDIVEDLKSFLNEKVGNQNVNIIGHSLGGLVGRIYSQKYFSNQKVNQIISIGSPHYGAVQVYKPIFFGEIDRENTFLWLAQKLVLQLNKKLFQSDKEAINEKITVLKDLLPTFNFLYDTNNREISFESLEIKNDYFLNYNQNFSIIFPIFKAIYGEKDDKTPTGYIVNENRYPISTLFSLGDYTVLSNSAYHQDDNDYKKINLDHGEIIYKNNAIKKILKGLG